MSYFIVAKSLLILFSLLFLVCGVFAFVIGVLALAHLVNVSTVTTNVNVMYTPVILVVFGIVCSTFGLVGFCGAYNHIRGLLIAYIIVMFLLFLLHIAVGMYMFHQVTEDTDDLRLEILNNLETMRLTYTEKEKSREMMNFIQQSVKCCGVYGPQDYNDNVPSTCCKHFDKSCNASAATLYHDGCVDNLYYSVKDNSKRLGYIALGMATLEAICAILAIIVMCLLIHAVDHAPTRIQQSKPSKRKQRQRRKKLTSTLKHQNGGDYDMDPNCYPSECRLDPNCYPSECRCPPPQYIHAYRPSPYCTPAPRCYCEPYVTCPYYGQAGDSECEAEPCCHSPPQTQCPAGYACVVSSIICNKAAETKPDLVDRGTCRCASLIKTVGEQTYTEPAAFKRYAPRYNVINIQYPPCSCNEE